MTTLASDHALQRPAHLNEPTRAKLTLDVYYGLVESGHLAQDERTELIDGEIYWMPLPGPDHAASDTGWLELLYELLPREQCLIRAGQAIRFDRLNETGPDIAVVRPRDDRYRSDHPTPADTLLLIENAHTSITYDTSTKLPLYARFGIADYWIHDLNQNALLVHRDPQGETYQNIQRLTAADTISPLAFPHVTIPLHDLLTP